MDKQPDGALGQWLAEICKAHGLSLRQAGEKTGLSHATIADIKKGVRPSAETIKKLAEAFGSDGHGKLALEDKLLLLAGYRTPRPDAEEPGQALAQLLGMISRFNEPQLEVVGRFIDLLLSWSKNKWRWNHRGH